MEETKKELAEDGEELLGKVTWISEEEFLQNVEKPNWIQKLCGQCNVTGAEADEKEQLPLYISIDKDILSESEGKTNWDQGNVVLDQVLQFIDVYMQQTPGRQFIGMDICGEDPEADNEEVQTVCRKTSEKICGFSFVKFHVKNVSCLIENESHCVFGSRLSDSGGK